MLEILNSGDYPSPIIVFVNQKKTADMVAKDLSRANVSRFVCVFFFHALIALFHSGIRLRCTRARTKNNERRRCKLSVLEMRISLWPQISPVVVSTYQTSGWLSTIRCRTQSRPTFIVLDELGVLGSRERRSRSCQMTTRKLCMISGRVRLMLSLPFGCRLTSNVFFQRNLQEPGLQGTARIGEARSRAAQDHEGYEEEARRRGPRIGIEAGRRSFPLAKL